MKNRLAYVVLGAVLGMTLIFSGGCCHMHRHHGDDCSPCNKPCCCKQCSDKPCDKPATDCPKAGGAPEKK